MPAVRFPSPSVGRMRRALTAAALVGAAPAFAAAQQAAHGDLSGSAHTAAAEDTAVEQIGAPEAGAPARIDQQALSGPSVLPAQVARDAETADAIPQLAAPADRGQDRVRQVTDADRTAAAGHQVSAGERSVTAAAPLSTPSQGKPEAVAYLGGKDRCDPQSAQADDPACAHAIENRAAEFTRPAPAELTPEQRLLIRQRALATDSTMQSTLRRIGRNDIDPDDPDAQSVASIVLDVAPPPAPSPAPAPEASPDVSSDVVVQTIINALQQ